MRVSKANKRVINPPITQTLAAAAMRVISPPVKASGIVSCRRSAIGDKRRQEKKKKEESRTQAEIFFCFACSSVEVCSVWQSERGEATRQRQNQRNALLERFKGKTVQFNGEGKKEPCRWKFYISSSKQGSTTVGKSKTLLTPERKKRPSALTKVHTGCQTNELTKDHVDSLLRELCSV